MAESQQPLQVTERDWHAALAAAPRPCSQRGGDAALGAAAAAQPLQVTRVLYHRDMYSMLLYGSNLKQGPGITIGGVPICFGVFDC